MIIIENDPSRIFKIAGTAAPDASTRTQEDAAALRVEALFNDLDVCRRVGTLISEAARRQQQVGSH
jgi:hypothetical protein